MGNSLKLNAKFFIRTLAVIASCTSFSSIAFAAGSTPTPVSGFFSVTPQSVPAHSIADLNTIFVTGSGPYDSTTMAGNIYPYSLPQNGVFNAPLYNGCYDSKNGRLSDLDADLSCTSMKAAHPDISIYRLFLGYKIECADQNPTPGKCNDASILMNCMYEQSQIGKGPFDAAVPTRYCSKGNPIVRRAKASASTTIAIHGCLPGTDGKTYPYCTPCSTNPGSYNDAVGENNSLCTLCTISDVTGIADPKVAAISLGADPANPPTKFVTKQITTGTTTTGATGSSLCQIDTTDTSWQCKKGFVKTSDNTRCEPITTCPINLTISSRNTSTAVTTDGSITAVYSGTTGTPTAFHITAPTPIEPTPLATPTGTFSNLGVGTYTLTVSDSNCTATTNVTLGVSPVSSPSPNTSSSPSPLPSVSPTPDLQCPGMMITSTGIFHDSYASIPASGYAADFSDQAYPGQNFSYRGTPKGITSMTTGTTRTSPSFPFGSLNCHLGVYSGGILQSGPSWGVTDGTMLPGATSQIACYGTSICTFNLDLTYGNPATVPGTVAAGGAGVFNYDPGNQQSILMVAGGAVTSAIPPSFNLLAWAKVIDGDSSGCGKDNGAACTLPNGQGTGKILRVKWITYQASVTGPSTSPSGSWQPLSGHVSELCTCFKP